MSVSRLRSPPRLAACVSRPASCGLRSAACGLRPAACGLRSAACGLRPAVCVLWSAVCGFRLSLPSPFSLVLNNYYSYLE
ncbi:hypothetical protein EH222_10570 [candidate division KSB1 bacterium]|nr:MAG: hypothetical protein EH222_10570 [candidate division KSB1 bacterium]